MLSRSVSFMSHLVHNSVLFISQICRVPKWLWLNCEGSATSLRRVRDTCDDFATILRGILSHKIFEHVQNFRNYFGPLGDTCEEIMNHWRLFRDCFATHSRCLSLAVAKQSPSSEIGALVNYGPFCTIWPFWVQYGHFGLSEYNMDILAFLSTIWPSNNNINKLSKRSCKCTMLLSDEGNSCPYMFMHLFTLQWRTKRGLFLVVRS